MGQLKGTHHVADPPPSQADECAAIYPELPGVLLKQLFQAAVGGGVQPAAPREVNDPHRTNTQGIDQPMAFMNCRTFR